MGFPICGGGGVRQRLCGGDLSAWPSAPVSVLHLPGLGCRVLVCPAVLWGAFVFAEGLGAGSACVADGGFVGGCGFAVDMLYPHVGGVGAAGGCLGGDVVVGFAWPVVASGVDEFEIEAGGWEAESAVAGEVVLAGPFPVFSTMCLCCGGGGGIVYRVWMHDHTVVGVGVLSKDSPAPSAFVTVCVAGCGRVG